MDSMDINMQLLALRRCLPDNGITAARVEMAGRLLAPFDKFDPEHYPALPEDIALAAVAYQKAGRLGDAAKAHRLFLSLFPKEPFANDSAAFLKAYRGSQSEERR